MKILHLSTFEQAGGAAIAASRLHSGLRLLGHASTLLVRQRTDGVDPTDGVVGLDALQNGVLTSPAIDALLHRVYHDGRADGVDCLFSTDLPTRDLADLSVVRDADIVNVHWAAGMLSAPALRRVQDLGTPTVWTLHDQAPFTGGCHYSGACRGYVDRCDTCPSLRPDAAHVPALMLRHKRRWLDSSRLTVVCPSRWLAEAARASALLREAQIHVIPNSVPVDSYERPSRDEARARLGLPDAPLVLLAGSDRLHETRKGHSHLCAAIRRLIADPAMRTRFADGSIVCATFGEGELIDADVPFVSLGRLSGDEQVALAYRAADVFLLPTLEDNLPNTLLESLAAGTPVVAYSTGGIPDVLGDGRGGVLVPHGDIAGFADGIRRLLTDTNLRARTREACHDLARRQFALSAQADAYLVLYERVLEAAHADGRSASALGAVRSHASFAADVAAAERVLVTEAAEPPLASRLLLEQCDQIASQQTLIASQGWEIAALRSELHATMETLRVAEAQLRQTSAERAALGRRLRQVAPIPEPPPERSAGPLSRGSAPLRVGIFGTGTGAMKVWEALAELDGADVVWFADNDPAQQHRRRLWLDVLVPADIPAREFDAIVIGSMRHAAIHRQLLCLGVAPAQILAPDVTAPLERVREQLAALCSTLTAMAMR